MQQKKKKSGYLLNEDGKPIAWYNPQLYSKDERIQELEQLVFEYRERIDRLETELLMIKSKSESHPVELNLDYHQAESQIKDFRRKIDSIFKDL